MNYWYLLYAAVFFAVILISIPMLKKWYYRRLMADLEARNFTAFEKDLDSFFAKMSFSAFERESMRLSMLQMAGKPVKADEQVQFMENMRLNKKQRAQLGERGFYVYLEQGKIKKARHMLDLVRQYGSEKQYHNLEMQYSILLKKESKYIDELIERHKALEQPDGTIPEALAMNAGTYEYLIGLQYYYKQDHQNKKLWLNRAKKHLKGTYYEDDINKMMRG